jgi:tetratricopeptide (TPR) repeat protein
LPTPGNSIELNQHLMPDKTQTDPLKGFVPRYLPWLLGALMLVIYGYTLNHWLTLMNISSVAQISGYLWQPQIYSPLQWLLTLPFHWLLAGKIPVMLNIFSAFCAALILVLLARCVAILPQDRTEPQRQREKSDHGFLTGWQAYFPPVLAVLMGGMQLVFWEHATSYTGEMVDLLLFAFIVWQLLEFRLDEKDWRLMVVAVAYGVGMAENWLFIGYFPIFLAAMIWSKKLEFFNVRFLVRMILLGLAGLSLILLLPLVGKFSSGITVGIWDLLRPQIGTDWHVIASIKEGGVRMVLAQASLSALVPVLLMSIRWSSSFGDNSRIGAVLAGNMVHFVHAAVFGLCVWVMFDVPFSPNKLAGNFPVMPLYGTSFLTFHFLAALSIGYCCGYFLLVFGRSPQPTRRNPRPQPLLPPALMWICPLVLAGVLVCSAAVVFTLVYKNRPIIREVNSDVLLKFANLATENLPKPPAVLLCDSDVSGQFSPLRAIIVQAALARDGRLKDYPVLDTMSLNVSSYHHLMHARYPDKIPYIIPRGKEGGVPPLAIFAMVGSLSTSNTLCYLNPSYGYYFERFYQEAHGLTYPLKKLPEDTLLPPPIGAARIAENEAFWDRAVAVLQPYVERAFNPPDYTKSKKPADWLLMHLHASSDVNQNAIQVGMFCSRSLNEWGVELQKAGELDKAAIRFQQALRFNPDNFVAQNNLDFNQLLRANTPPDIEPGKVTPDAFGRYRSWNEVVTADGPFDDASFRMYAGLQLTQGQNLFFRQAAAEFARVVQIVPNNLFARLQLAQIYLLNRLPDKALEHLREPLDHPDKFELTSSNSVNLNVLVSAAYFQQNKLSEGSRLLEQEVNRHPDDNVLLVATTQAYFTHGLYTNALRIIETRLKQSPDDPTWLFGKGYAYLQLGDYGAAVNAMTRVLEIQTNNSAARFNRGLAYFKSDKFDAANADYLALQDIYTNSFQIAFGLGEIAWQKKDNAEALRNYQIYLANAPTNSLEFSNVTERVKSLKR